MKKNKVINIIYYSFCSIIIIIPFIFIGKSAIPIVLLSLPYLSINILKEVFNNKKKSINNNVLNINNNQSLSNKKEQSIIKCSCNKKKKIRILKK